MKWAPCGGQVGNEFVNGAPRRAAPRRGAAPPQTAMKKWGRECCRQRQRRSGHVHVRSVWVPAQHVLTGFCFLPRGEAPISPSCPIMLPLWASGPYPEDGSGAPSSEVGAEALAGSLGIHAVAQVHVRLAQLPARARRWGSSGARVEWGAHPAGGGHAAGERGSGTPKPQQQLPLSSKARGTAHLKAIWGRSARTEYSCGSRSNRSCSTISLSSAAAGQGRQGMSLKSLADRGIMRRCSTLFFPQTTHYSTPQVGVACILHSSPVEHGATRERVTHRPGCAAWRGGPWRPRPAR